MQEYELTNGIKVIEDPIADAASFTILVMFKTGSRNETPNIWGISHFLEHMAFKGTPSYPNAALLAKELDGLGALYNAFTSKEYTGYFIKGSRKILPKAISIISEMTLSPIILDEEVDKERGTIVEEVHMSEDDPRRRVYDLFEESIYENKQISQDTLGTEASLSGIHAKEIIDYREKYYRSGNAVIAVSGFVPSDLEETLEKSFSAMLEGKNKYLTSILETRKQINITYKETQQTHLAIGFPGVDVHNKDRVTAQVLSILLGGNMSSRMFSEVREERGLAYYVNTYSDNMDDAGILVTFAGVNNEKALEAIRIIRDVYKSVLTEIPEEEIQKTKDYISGMITLSYEDSEKRSEVNAITELYGEQQKTLEQRLSEIEAVTTEEVVVLANKLFNDKKICLALIGPFKDEAEFAKILGLK